MVAAARVEPIIVVNMLTDTLDSQLDFLAAVAAAGIPVTRVELGNGSVFCVVVEEGGCMSMFS